MGGRVNKLGSDMAPVYINFSRVAAARAYQRRATIFCASFLHALPPRQRSAAKKCRNSRAASGVQKMAKAKSGSGGQADVSLGLFYDTWVGYRASGENNGVAAYQ